MKNKKKNEKKALIGSLSLAAIVVAGATFAWFTSQDQVTNRLSAKAEYDVSITESFTPPSDWTPGQKINKDVNAVNTGNVDSLVKLTFGHSFTVTGKGDSITVSAAAAEDLAGKKAVEIDEAKAKAIQAGGYIVYNKNTVAPGTQEESTTLYTDDGLYIFRREIKKEVNGNKLVTTTYNFDGYYVKGGKYYRVDIADDAVTMNNTTGEVTAVDTAKVTIPTVGDKYVYTYGTDSSVTWKFVDELTEEGNVTNDFAEAKGIRVTYAGKDAESTDDDIVVYVEFDPDAKDYYTYRNDATDEETFYYNYVLPAGQDTKKPLITSVTLGKETKESAYIELDYDLDVILNSIQASVNEDKEYTNESADSWWTGSTVNGEQNSNGATVISDTNGKVTWGGSGSSETP